MYKTFAKLPWIHAPNNRDALDVRAMLNLTNLITAREWAERDTREARYDLICSRLDTLLANFAEDLKNMKAEARRAIFQD